jgi:hypothetical protein
VEQMVKKYRRKRGSEIKVRKDKGRKERARD